MLARLGGNFAAQIFGIFLSFADRFLVVGLLLRTLGTDPYADWVLLLSSAGLLSLAELGLNIYYGNIWQSAFAKGDEPRFQRMLGFALTCSGLLGLALLLFCLGLVSFIDFSQTLSLTGLTRGAAAAIFLLLGAATASRSMRGAVSQLYRGRLVFAVGTMIDQIFPASLVVAMLITVNLTHSLVTLAAVYLACDLVAGWGAMLFNLKRRFPHLHFRPNLPNRTEFLDLVHHVRWFAVQQGAPVLWLQAPVLILGWLGVAGPTLVSFLILRTLVNFARQLASMLSISAGVELASSYHSGKHEEFLRRLGTFGSSLSGIGGAIAVAITIFGAPFIAIWTGQESLYDTHILVWLLGTALISAPILPMASAMMLCNLPKPAALANLIQIGIGIPAIFIFVRMWGAMGAAMGLALGETVAFGIVFPIFATKALEFSYTRYIGRCLATMAICSLWCGLVGFGLKWAINPIHLGSFFVTGALWSVLGLIPALFITLPAAQQRTLLGAGLRLRARLFHR